MKNLYTILILFIGTLSTFAQSAGVSGSVVDQNNKPLLNVNITISHTSLGTTTDAKGKFEVTDLAPGAYTLTFSIMGHDTKQVQVNVVANRIKEIPNVSLPEKSEQLNEVVVKGHHNKYAVKTPSSSLRLKTEVAKLPQNIQIISSELLQDQQATSIMDGVIRNVSGVTMLEHWGNFARVNMRGFRLPAFRNGFNVQDSWGPLSEDMAFVDQIEFVKGPAGFMMSAGEPGGFYNVVTKKPTERTIRQVSLMAGSFDNYRGTLDLGGKATENGKLLYRFNAMYQTADSHRGNEDAERYGFAPALTYKLSQKTAVTAELNVQQAESYMGAAYVFAPNDDGYGSLDRDFKFTDTNYPASDIQEVAFFGTIKHDFNRDWSWETKFGSLRYDQVGNSNWVWSLEENGDAVRYISNWDALSVGKYFQSYITGAFHTGGINHNILGGFDYSQKEYWADFNQFGLTDVNQPFNIYNPVYGNTELPIFDKSTPVQYRDNIYNYGGINRSVYLQDEIGFFNNKARLTLAGRYTHLFTRGKDETDSKITPRIGLSVDILPTLSAYGLYDRSFIGQNGVSFTGEAFDPVDANDIEGGLKKSFFNGRLRTSLGAYQITKENVLVTDPENPNFSIQLGEIQSKGIEFDLQGEVTPELNVILNYANTNVEITEDTDPENIGQRVAGHAKHITNGWLNYKFSEESKLHGFGGSLGYQYQIDRSTWSWGADNESQLPDYFRLDGALSWSNDKLRVQLNVNNLLDEYLYSGSNYAAYLYWQSEPGINGRVTVTYNF
ncbi:TonB-dependent receptor [Maribacter sp. 1_2014MBL_MicDiv]|uniref:TonB-dependent receptor n=1 Tax=Maribacter sp. 1_2014MBL_MicDiv TaxID=1644130 RepID=UPI0008F46963|nr:TonB-dependent receptor [Maribacter sp. 1_2014MBL_MicDiv]APA65055.1 TonB-dependent receptor [Maribacter sp. 1_2014MBL_MicDiv]